MSRRRRGRWLVWLVILIILLSAGGVLFLKFRPKLNEKAPKTAQAIQKYQCPMHPWYISNKPGNCPICGMKLVPVKKAAERKKILSKVKGYATVYITSQRQQLIGVRTTVAQVRSLKKVIRTVGLIQPDETRLATISPKIGGWIEKLYLDFTGQVVKKGQPLLSIYSPELVSTQEEYLLALQAKKRLSKSSFPEVAKSGDFLIEASRRRLELWDIPQSEIRKVERSGKPIKSLTLYAPFSGVVMKKMATEGTNIQAGQAIYELADLRNVWVQADIYEYELSLIKEGQRAKLTLNSFPGKYWYGRVSYIYPYLEGQTRTMKARFNFPNPGLLLKPEMYANVEFEIPLGSMLSVPQEAVLDSGTRQIIFVDKGDGYFEPREVKLGQKTDGYVSILKGISPGEKVVVSGNFMIDSESQLESAIEGMGEPKHGAAVVPQKEKGVPPASAPSGGQTGMKGMNM